MADPFGLSSVQAAVQQTLAAAEGSGAIAPHHQFATVLNLQGVQVALATRTASGWVFDVDGGYDRTAGANAGFTLGKSWK
jgi:hypothetical protein